MKWWKILSLILPIVSDLLSLVKDRIKTKDRKIKLRMSIGSVTLGESHYDGEDDKHVIVPLHVEFKLKYPSKYFDEQTIIDQLVGSKETLSAALNEGLDGRQMLNKECKIYVKNCAKETSA